MSIFKFLRKGFLVGLNIVAAFYKTACIFFGDYYEGYRLIWTGWKSIYNQMDIIGQWIAIPVDETRTSLYASNTGAEGCFFPGQVIDVCHYHPYEWCYGYTVKSILARVKKETRQRLLRLIDAEILGIREGHLRDYYANL